MDKAHSIYCEYQAQQSKLQSEYAAKIEEVFPKRIIDKVDETYKELFTSVKGYDIIERYNKLYDTLKSYDTIPDKVEETDKNDVIKDLIIDAMNSLYKEIYEKQIHIIKLFDIPNPDFYMIRDITWKLSDLKTIMFPYLNYISEDKDEKVIVPILRVLQVLRDIESIHDKHNLIFMKTSDILMQSSKVYDEVFISMSPNDIKETNEKIMKETEREREQVDKIKNAMKKVSNYGWRPYPSLFIESQGC